MFQISYFTLNFRCFKISNFKISAVRFEYVPWKVSDSTSFPLFGFTYKTEKVSHKTEKC